MCTSGCFNSFTLSLLIAMSEVDLFTARILKRVVMLPEELQELVSAFKLGEIKKKQFIIQLMLDGGFRGL
jgi:hypothetical protein